MQRLTTFLFKRFDLKRVLGVLLAGILLFTSTACNNGTETGARPFNPPVQMGGNNNPHKSGGDGYTGFKASTDPRVNANTNKSISPRADAESTSVQLIAATSIAPSVNDVKSNLLYPSSESADRTDRQANNAAEDVTIRSQFKQDVSTNSGIASVNDSKENLLEKVGDTLKDASAFLKDKADEAGARPEMQANPGVQRKR